jgi:predicted O-methyltransferase YrrM
LRSLKGKFSSFRRRNEKPFSTRLKEQDDAYSQIGLTIDRKAIQKRLDQCLLEVGFPSYSEDCGMYSEHLMLFSALSISDQHIPLNILEIGTYDGKSACVLSRLFPQATITTIDLRDDDPIFVNSYGRENQDVRQGFLNDRNKNLSKAGANLFFIQDNSLHLSRREMGHFDLIWLDGAHGYPVACCDITNSIRLLSNQGILMCDDVWTKIAQSDKIYSSIASWETLLEFDNAGITRTKLLRKRLGDRHLSAEKFVAFTRLR